MTESQREAPTSKRPGREATNEERGEVCDDTNRGQDHRRQYSNSNRDRKYEEYRQKQKRLSMQSHAAPQYKKAEYESDNEEVCDTENSAERKRQKGLKQHKRYVSRQMPSPASDARHRGALSDDEDYQDYYEDSFDLLDSYDVEDHQKGQRSYHDTPFNSSDEEKYTNESYLDSDSRHIVARRGRDRGRLAGEDNHAAERYHQQQTDDQDLYTRYARHRGRHRQGRGQHTSHDGESHPRAGESHRVQAQRDDDEEDYNSQGQRS